LSLFRFCFCMKELHSSFIARLVHNPYFHLCKRGALWLVRLLPHLIIVADEQKQILNVVSAVEIEVCIFAITCFEIVVNSLNFVVMPNQKEQVRNIYCVIVVGITGAKQSGNTIDIASSEGNRQTVCLSICVLFATPQRKPCISGKQYFRKSIFLLRGTHQARSAAPLRKMRETVFNNKEMFREFLCEIMTVRFNTTRLTYFHVYFSIIAPEKCKMRLYPLLRWTNYLQVKCLDIRPLHIF